MVHALREAHRVLEPLGLLLDLRPHYGPSRLQLPAGGGWRTVGPATLPRPDEDLIASDRAVAAVVESGLFRRRQQEVFLLYRYFQDVEELVAYSAERWTDSELDPATLERVRKVGGRPSVRLEQDMLLQSLERLGT